LMQEVNIQDEHQITHHLQSKKSQDIFQRCFEKLLEVRVKKSFQLTVKLTWNGYLIYCMLALERSRGVVNKLLEEGARVTVLAWDRARRREYDASDYYMLSSVDWQRMWIKKVRKDHRGLGLTSSLSSLHQAYISLSTRSPEISPSTTTLLANEPPRRLQNKRREQMNKTRLSRDSWLV
jgi:hypothetical protein